MPTETISSPIGEVRAVSASLGLSLTTAAATLGFPKGTQAFRISPRNFTTAVVVRFALNPYLLVYKTTDALATSANLTDYSDAAQDNDVATDVVLSLLNTNAASNALWIGAELPFRGLSVDVDAANAAASVLTGTFWNGSALTNISLTDNTASGGATFAVDGTITWTVPSTWVKASLKTIAAGSADIPLGGRDLYWVKLVVSAQLGASVTLNSIHALNRSTSYCEIASADIWEGVIRRGLGGIGSIEALTDAGTANLLVNALTFGASGRFF